MFYLLALLAVLGVSTLAGCHDTTTLTTEDLQIQAEGLLKENQDLNGQLDDLELAKKKLQDDKAKLQSAKEKL